MRNTSSFDVETSCKFSVLVDDEYLLNELGSGHFQSWVPGRRIFGRGMKLFSTTLWGYENTKSNFYGLQNYFD